MPHRTTIVVIVLMCFLAPVRPTIGGKKTPHLEIPRLPQTRTVDWHPRYSIQSEGKMKSNRVDVGVFATNGEEWSASAFLTWYCPNNEKREYSDDGELMSRKKLPGRYMDPTLDRKVKDHPTKENADDESSTEK